MPPRELPASRGRRGAYYSKRLHHAAVRFVTDNGNDEDAYEKILQERFGVTTRITNHTTYRELTAGTTDEPAWRFQEFHAEEIVQIINTLEEMPAGMRAIAGLKYLVRRQDGTLHPLHPGAPAVAWTGSGYIEFMEKAFNTSSILSVHRLIIHEKAHFLWAYLFGDQLKEDWIELGGWYPDANEPDGWSTTKQTEFVSAYAHRKNPNEDMAESIAYFVINPGQAAFPLSWKVRIRERSHHAGQFLHLENPRGLDVRGVQPLPGLCVSREDPPGGHRSDRRSGRGQEGPNRD